jgi:hypothetical protein
MKPSDTTTRQIRVQIPSLERPDSGTAVVKKTRKQLIDELAMTVCESTGTHSYDVADRILSQVVNAQVWPKPTDDDDCVIDAIAFIRERPPRM